MNGHRYKCYLDVSRALSSDLFNALEREVLKDAAEGLLLTSRADSPEVIDLEATVDAALEGLVAGGRIHVETAAKLRERLAECGPQRVTSLAA